MPACRHVLSASGCNRSQHFRVRPMPACRHVLSASGCNRSQHFRAKALSIGANRSRTHSPALPDAPRSICRDCNQTALIGSPYCQAHQHDNRALRAARDRNTVRRASGLKRLYDSPAWRRRAVPFVLGRDPLCQLGIICGGRARSTDVDHIIRAEIYIGAHQGDETFFFDTDNLRGLCHADHSHKTALENSSKWIEPGAPVDPDLDG